MDNQKIKRIFYNETDLINLIYRNKFYKNCFLVGNSSKNGDVFICCHCYLDKNIIKCELIETNWDFSEYPEGYNTLSTIVLKDFDKNKLKFYKE